MNNDLVQIGKKDNTSFKKGILKKLQNQFKEEWDITGGLSAPAKMPGYGYSIPASACITGAKLAEIKGTTCYSCYALRGNYVYPNVDGALKKRLFNLDHPLWAPYMATLINSACSQLAEPYFRWHDAGDLQGVWHLEKIIDTCRMTPSIKHWLPTREYAFMKEFKKEDMPSNLIVRLSAHKIDGIPPSHHWNTSTVTSDENRAVTLRSMLCEAYTREGFCGSCRACWDKKIEDVSYPKH